jgi:hypothetical protein
VRFSPHPAEARPAGPTGHSPGRRRRPGLPEPPILIFPRARRTRRERWVRRPRRRSPGWLRLEPRSCRAPAGAERSEYWEGAADPSLLRRLGLRPASPSGAWIPPNSTTTAKPPRLDLTEFHGLAPNIPFGRRRSLPAGRQRYSGTVRTRNFSLGTGNSELGSEPRNPHLSASGCNLTRWLNASAGRDASKTTGRPAPDDLPPSCLCRRPVQTVRRRRGSTPADTHASVAEATLWRVIDPGACGRLRCVSTDSRPQRTVTSRVIRPGGAEPPDMEWLRATPSERIEAVWRLTRLCLAWNSDPDGEPRLQRSVSRIQRPGR